jgi:hypothetical protein
MACLCFFADRVHFEGEFAFQFTIAEDLDPVGLADQTVGVKVFQGELGDVRIFRSADRSGRG